MVASHITTGYANSKSYLSLVNVSGAPGVLTAVGIAGADSYHYFRVSIDGNVVADEFLCASLGASYENNGLGVNLPFEKELGVEIRDDVPSVLPRFWCSFTISSSKKIGEQVGVEEREGVGYVYSLGRFTAKEKEYTIRALQGNARTSEISLERDTYFKSQLVKGMVKLKDWQNKPLRETKVGLILKLVGHTTVLERFAIGDVSGERTLEFKSPEFPGRLQLAADLAGYANFPATFTVI